MAGSDNFSRDKRRTQELEMRPVADRIYKSVFGSDLEVSRFDNDYILDMQFAIDVKLKFPSGLIMLGQEKFLSREYSKYRSVTVEHYQNPVTNELGDWFKLGVQFYFTGYMTEDKSWFDPWIMLDWARVVLDTHNGKILWVGNENKNGHARASFRYYPMDKFSTECCICASDDVAVNIKKTAIQRLHPIQSKLLPTPILNPRAR